MPEQDVTGGQSDHRKRQGRVDFPEPPPPIAWRHHLSAALDLSPPERPGNEEPRKGEEKHDAEASRTEQTTHKAKGRGVGSVGIDQVTADHHQNSDSAQAIDQIKIPVAARLDMPALEPFFLGDIHGTSAGAFSEL